MTSSGRISTCPADLSANRFERAIVCTRSGKRQICVQRSGWKGHVTAPKGGRLRYVPMTVRLATALREHRHLRAARVLCRNSAPLSADVVKHYVERAARRARLSEKRCASPATYVLLASGDARGAGTGDPGAGWPQRSDHDAALHAPQSGGARGGDPAAGIDRGPQKTWRHFGDGGS